MKEFIGCAEKLVASSIVLNPLLSYIPCYELDVDDTDTRKKCHRSSRGCTLPVSRPWMAVEIGDSHEAVFNHS